MSESRVVIDWVDRKFRGVAAIVETPRNVKNKVHRIGHLPSEGWWCNQCGKRCAQIKRVKALVPDMEEKRL